MLLGLGASAFWLVAAAESGEPAAARAPGRVVVVPVNLAVRAVPEVQSGIEPVWRALLAYFVARRPTVALARNDAGLLWNEVMAEAQQAGDDKDLYANYARFARRVAEQAQFDRIVFPTIVMTPARLSARSANWDGVHRIIEIPGQFSESIDTYRDGKIWLNRDGASGELAAASLHVALFTMRGELRYEGRGGLVLLQEIVAPAASKPQDVELSVVLRPDPFAAPDQLREGIEAAFRAWFDE
jgi:hypothetical protein